MGWHIEAWGATRAGNCWPQLQPHGSPKFTAWELAWVRQGASIMGPPAGRPNWGSMGNHLGTAMGGGCGLPHLQR